MLITQQQTGLRGSFPGTPCVLQVTGSMINKGVQFGEQVVQHKIFKLLILRKISGISNLLYSSRGRNDRCHKSVS